ncbi:MAG TPA: isoleucine--tRNA ligase [Candidatus Limnocylindrales bacterium]|nr:isoleucine--tRNA ligase [Candidatus Limnocylindrales bacterium]
MSSLFRPVSKELDVPALERDVIERWRERDTMTRYLGRNDDSDRRFSFIDGPITANNPMGVHHAWGRTYKDLFQRYHTMLGERQRYQNGFDCQGLWIEVEVEKELGLNNKQGIEAYGIDRFVELCKARVAKFAAIQTEQSKRLGYWMDWDNSYFTNSDENNYTIWAFLAECHSRGLLRKGHDVMPWCPRCGTGLSNMEIATEGYRDLRHLSVTVRFPITNEDHEGEDLLVWTTTPWTLSSNVAVAVHPQLVYQLVEVDGRRSWVSAGSKVRVARDAEVLREAHGQELVGLAYHGPFDELPIAAPVEHRVIPWGEVSDAEGTGIVHIAPGCGQEDFALAKVHDLPVLDPIDQFGIFGDGYGWQTGRYAGATEDAGVDLARDVAADLDSKGLLVAKESYLHSYPVCWRCGTQLLFRLVDEWFISMDPLREPISASTRSMDWLPEGIGLRERELDWLRNMDDWMISKKRYYGLALPIWECGDCEGWEVIGSKDELRERAIAGWDAFDGHSPHRPWVDAVEIACPSCGGVSRRTTDVGNPWLDAGIVGLSTLKWNSDREYWKEWYPANLVTESFPGQFRNWFYALLTMSTVMTGEAPSRALFAYALMRDEHGEEMHKSKGNSIAFEDAADQIGADVMRWMFAAANPATNINFGYGPGHEVVRRFLLPLWNTYGFFVTYARLDGWTPEQTEGVDAARTLLDRWVLSRLDSLVGGVREALDRYEPMGAARAIEAFVGDLSNWYVRRNRRRFWKGELDADKRAAYATLHEVLATLTRLLAPFVPHVADAIWENLVVTVTPDAPDSVHLADFPERVAGRADRSVDAAVDLARRTVALGRAARSASAVRTRQPLRTVRVKLPAGSDGFGADEAIEADLRQQIREELNVREIELIPDESEMVERTLYPLLPVIGPRHGAAVGTIMAGVRSGTWRINDDGTATVGEVTLQPDEFQLTARGRPGHEVAEDGDLLVGLDTTLDDELAAEGMAREVAHRLQAMRKAAGYEISDRVRVAIAAAPEIAERLLPHRAWLADELLATSVQLETDGVLSDSDADEALEVDGFILRLSVGRS